MTTYLNIEWIGVKSPTTDEVVDYLKLVGYYTPLQESTLDAVNILLAPRIRQAGTRIRELLAEHLPGGTSGLSQSYRWGPHRPMYVQRVTENDARVILSCSNEYEFRNLDDPAHDNRVPIVPPEFINDVLHRILVQAQNAGKPVLGVPVIYADAEGALREVRRQQENARR